MWWKKPSFILLALLFLALAGLLVINADSRGFVLTFSILLFGFTSSVLKEGELKIASLAFLLGLAVLNLLLYGLNLGIDFAGGIRVPLVVERPLTGPEMQELVDAIKGRVSSLGLTQVKVMPVGDQEVYIEVPATDETTIDKIEQLVTQQGVFKAVVDGQVVLEGKDILTDTIAPRVIGEGRWAVSFTITGKAAEEFAKKVKGKANYPLYMFLDRPENAVVILSRDALLQRYNDYDPADVLLALKDPLKGSSIEVIFLEDINGSNLSLTNKTIITSQEIANALRLNDSNVKIVSDDELYPILVGIPGSDVTVDRWDAVGLLSSPRLSEGITTGVINLNYQISGSAKDNAEAEERAKFIASILKGGVLPAKLYIGSKTFVPAPLGEKFFSYSMIALLTALVAVSLFVAIRYRNLVLTAPILAITIAELIILTSTIGSFTLDLAAMAGVIAAIGVSIDAQIVITDELLSKEGTKEEKLQKAFNIVNNSATVAILAMLPLFFSSLVEIIGFATVAILGALLGVLISRPSYAVIAERLMEHVRGGNKGS